MLNPNFIEHLVQAGVVMALTDLGLTSGEMSQTQAKKVYGLWFTKAVADGRLKPTRQGNGTSATKFFSVADILKLRAYESQEVTIKNL